ncbi:hypothetical protein I4U23_002550 [Adineta vaga]|nr:hypothetical protein I4U23_002550 [Adineta vaga]
MMIRIFYCLFVVIPLFSCTPEKKIHLHTTLSSCLRDIVNVEISVAYNYLQLSSKVGAQNAYPGFSSLFTKLSDEDSSKGHELVKFIALRRAELSDQLIQDKTTRVM